MAKKKVTPPVEAPEEEHFETYEEVQARIRLGAINRTPRPDHQNSHGHPFYMGSPDVDPGNELLQFGDPDSYSSNLNRENR